MFDDQAAQPWYWLTLLLLTDLGTDCAGGAVDSGRWEVASRKWKVRSGKWEVGGVGSGSSPLVRTGGAGVWVRRRSVEICRGLQRPVEVERGSTGRRGAVSRKITR